MEFCHDFLMERISKKYSSVLIPTSVQSNLGMDCPCWELSRYILIIMLLLFKWKQYQQRYKQDHSCYLFLFQIANEFPTLLHLLRPNPNSVLLWKRWLIFFNPSLVWRSLTEGSLRMQCTENLWSICVGLQVSFNSFGETFTEKSYNTFGNGFH